MSTRITYLLVGSPGSRQLGGVCDDCGAENPDGSNAYDWGRAHTCL